MYSQIIGQLGSFYKILHQRKITAEQFSELFPIMYHYFKVMALPAVVFDKEDFKLKKRKNICYFKLAVPACNLI